MNVKWPLCNWKKHTRLVSLNYEFDALYQIIYSIPSPSPFMKMNVQAQASLNTSCL